MRIGNIQTFVKAELESMTEVDQAFFSMIGSESLSKQESQKRREELITRAIERAKEHHFKKGHKIFSFRKHEVFALNKKNAKKALRKLHPELNKELILDCDLEIK